MASQTRQRMAFAAVQDPGTAKELSAICGEHVVATAEGNSARKKCRLRAGQSGKQRT